MTAYLSVDGPLDQPQVVWAAEHFSILFKPPGMAVQPDARGDLDLATWYQVDCAVVGRLDRPVSGLVLVATTAEGRTRLQTAQSERKLTKIYRARLSAGAPRLPARLEHGWRFERGLAHATPLGAPRTKPMRTQVLEQTTAWVELQLITGRRHQLRVQLAAHGCPILGDRRYGGVRSDRVHLASVGIGLPGLPVYRLDEATLTRLGLAG